MINLDLFFSNFWKNSPLAIIYVQNTLDYWILAKWTHKPDVHGWLLIPVPLGFLHLDPSLVFLQAYLVQNCGGLDILDPFENRAKVKYKGLSIFMD